MKQSVELEIPDGWEIDELNQYSITTENPSSTRRSSINVFLKKKQPTKDFAFYVDQYLTSSGVSTNNQIENWLQYDQLLRIKQNLKTGGFEFVPWEIKIGLFKYICEQKGFDIMSVVTRIVNIGADDVVAKDWFPIEYINDLFKTK